MSKRRMIVLAALPALFLGVVSLAWLDSFLRVPQPTTQEWKSNWKKHGGEIIGINHQLLKFWSRNPGDDLWVEFSDGRVFTYLSSPDGPEREAALGSKDDERILSRLMSAADITLVVFDGNGAWYQWKGITRRDYFYYDSSIWSKHYKAVFVALESHQVELGKPHGRAGVYYDFDRVADGWAIASRSALRAD